MRDNLIELVAGVINVPPSMLSADSGPANLEAWDSLAHVTIVAAAEQTFGVTLTMPEILGIKTIGDLDSVLQRHGAR